MRFLLFISLFFFLDPVSAQEEKQPLKDLFNEYYVSVNHGIGKGFFGGGLGVNHVFHPDKIVSIRTGLDLQYFQTWGNPVQPSHYSSERDVRCLYVNFDIPVVVRINFHWAFIELGANFGVGLAGQRSATVTTSYDYQPSVESTKKESWNPGFSVGPVLGIGARIPLNDKLELLVRPDVGASLAFRYEFMNFYGRLCIGIHLK